MFGDTAKVKVGDVIDLADADVTQARGRVDKNLRIIIRAKQAKGVFLTLFAPEYAIGWQRARVTEIKSVVTQHRVRNNTMNVFTHATVEVEDAAGELPTLYAENKLTKPKAWSDNREWVRPEFTSGGVKDATEEEN